ncbi:MAG: hypothetical protein ACI9FJ_002107 [Alteromonadaceae bacterium]|jgi:hypothetical protein
MTGMEKESQKSVFRFMVWLTVFIIIMSSAVSHFADIFDSVEQTEADIAVQVYAASVISVHRDWILQGRPKTVVVKGVNAAGKAQGQWIFVMNQFGWPTQVVGSQTQPVCQALWQALQTSDRLSFSGELFEFRLNQQDSQRPDQVANNALDEARLNIQVCRNTVAGEVRFSYRFDTGKVELRP